MSKIEEVSQAVINGKSKDIVKLVDEAIAEGCDPAEILNVGMIEAMGIVGERFQKNEIFVPEMLVAARAMKKGVNVLKPHLSSDSVSSSGKLILGTVSGDLHDIGKNLVGMMLEGAGFEVNDLGVDVPIEKFVETIKATPDVKIVALSALLTTTMPSLQKTVETLKKMDESANFKILVGGAPITQ